MEASAALISLRRAGSRLAAGLLGPVLALAGCSGGAAAECARLFDAEEHESAAMVCEQVFEETGDPRWGVLAARAQHALDRHEEMELWLERLRGSAEEPVAWRLVSRSRWQLGEAQGAREAGLRELELRRRLGQHDEAADSAYALFYYGWASADYRAALQAARESLEEASQAGDGALVLRALQALQVVLYEVGDLERARAILQEATARAGPEEPHARARLMVYDGLILLNTSRPFLARDAFERALELATSLDEDAFFRSTHLNLVKANLELGEVDRAERHLGEAWAHADPQGRRLAALLYYRARLLHARGRHAEAAEALEAAQGEVQDAAWARDVAYEAGVVAEALGDLERAKAAYARAADAVEGMRESLGGGELAAWLLDRKRHPLEALFRLQAGTGRNREALATLERAKAHTFLDSLADAADASEAPRGAAEIARAAETRLAALDALLPPLYASSATPLLPVDELLAAAGDRNVLAYFDTRDALWLLALVGGRLDAYRLPESPAAVARQVHRFLARPEDPETAAYLGRALLPEGALPAVGALLHIVPDGDLGTLPFAALRRGGRYLVEDYTIVYAPNLAATVVVEAARHDGYGPPVVLADPLGDLPAAAAEAREVAIRMGVEAAVGEAASLATLERASRAGLLHLATHSGLGSAGPWLELADGRVAADALLTARVAPRLVVLASCSSAAPRGRGVWGSLGTGFLAAGSRAVLASLWPVEDAAARELVLEFYDEGGTVAPAEALARAQRAMIAAGRGPTAWAPFVLMGSPEG
jgi:tetratricopeptide (TPR) repeat protein